MRHDAAAEPLQGQTINAINLRNAHLVDESARIGRDRFEVSALRLGIQGAEGERRSCPAGHPSEDYAAVAWNHHIHVLQAVLARATNTNAAIGGVGHRRGIVVRRNSVRESSQILEEGMEEAWAMVCLLVGDRWRPSYWHQCRAQAVARRRRMPLPLEVTDHDHIAWRENAEMTSMSAGSSTPYIPRAFRLHR